MPSSTKIIQMSGLLLVGQCTQHFLIMQDLITEVWQFCKCCAFVIQLPQNHFHCYDGIVNVDINWVALRVVSSYFLRYENQDLNLQRAVYQWLKKYSLWRLHISTLWRKQWCFTLHQGGITCGAIDEPRKSSKAIDERVIINFRDKNGVIARFRDKNVYR